MKLLPKGDKNDDHSMSPMHSLPRDDKKKQLIPLKNTFTKVNFYPSQKFSNSLGKTIDGHSDNYESSPLSIGIKGIKNNKQYHNKNNFNNVIIEENEYADNNKLKKSYFNNKFYNKGANLKNIQLPNITKNYFFK